MSLASPALTTTSYKKRKAVVTKAQQAELERGWRERNVRLRDMGLPKETLEQYIEWVYGHGKKTTAKTQDKSAHSKTAPSAIKRARGVDAHISTDNVPNISTATTRPWITGPVSSKPSPVYTGTEMIGITVLHKSCLQPVFNKEAAEDAAKMRR